MTYIIAEAGVNHNGDLDAALQMCREAKAVPEYRTGSNIPP